MTDIEIRFSLGIAFDEDGKLIPGCMNCLWYHWDAKTNIPTCDAYPGGIPLLIRSGEVPHLRRLPGDRDRQWQLDPIFGDDNA